MKVTISQRFVYHKVGTVEIEINKKDYEKYLIDNKGYHSLDDYLLENEDLWSEQIHNATDKSELEFGSGCFENGFNQEGCDAETRFDCEETNDGGHL